MAVFISLLILLLFIPTLLRLIIQLAMLVLGFVLAWAALVKMAITGPLTWRSRARFLAVTGLVFFAIIYQFLFSL